MLNEKAVIDPVDLRAAIDPFHGFIRPILQVESGRLGQDAPQASGEATGTPREPPA